MEYNDFLNEVTKGVEEYLTEKGLSKNVMIRKVVKNNDIELDALSITEKMSNVSPTIYLNKYYDEYLTGKSISEIASDIGSLYMQQKDKINFNINLFRCLDYMKDKIAYKLIGQKYNKKLLQNIPHIDFLDLAIVFYFVINNEDSQSATALIHNAHMETWGVTKEELYEFAKINTPVLLPYQLRNMEDIVKDILVEKVERKVEETGILKESYESEYGTIENLVDTVMENDGRIKDDGSMYVLTNKSHLFGATCILYKDLLKNFSNQIASDLYIIPCSVHEVIIVPLQDHIKQDEINNMITEVNSTGIEEGEILSDHVYLYSRKTDKITM